MSIYIEPRDWCAVTGYEGLYEVSRRGEVRSVRRRGTAGGLLRQWINVKGYPSVKLSKGGHEVTERVHALIAQAFLGPRPVGQQVRHLDGVKTNCAVANLHYGTSSENRLDSVGHGSHNNARKTHCPRDHEYTPENTYINPRGSRECRECRRQRGVQRGSTA